MPLFFCADGSARTSAVWSPSFWRTWATSGKCSTNIIIHSCHFMSSSSHVGDVGLITQIVWCPSHVKIIECICQLEWDLSFDMVWPIERSSFFFERDAGALCLVRTAAGIGLSGTIGRSWNRAVADFMGLWQLRLAAICILTFSACTFHSKKCYLWA